jgi:uncharacterized protein (DUF433 family)
MTTLAYPHIEIDTTGEPLISGTDTKVILIAIDRLAHNWDANEIQRQRPHLTLGQIYSALGYYYDHELEMNQLIDQRLRHEDDLLSKLGNSRVRAKLQAAKRSS